MKVCGEAWSPPHTTYWNIHGDTTGFLAQQDTKGVTMLSGFSPSLLELVLSGERLSDYEEIGSSDTIEEDGEFVLINRKMARTPYSTVREALDNAEYD